MYRPLPEFLTIKNSTIEGLGLWTTKLIKAGTNLGITHKEMIDLKMGILELH